jgi:hypothetical protein
MNILHSRLTFQQWVGLNSTKSNLVCILSIVGQKKKCRVFSYPIHSLSWFPRFWSKTNMWYGGHIRCWIWTKRGMLFLKTTYHSCKVSVSNKKAKPICLMVFNNIYVISWWSVLFVEETGGPGEIRIITKLPNSEQSYKGKVTDLSQVTDKLYHIMFYTSPWLRFELTTSVVIGTDCIGSCKSYYRAITATTAPYCNRFVMRILNYQMSAINYVLLSKDICKGVKRVIIDKGGIFDINSDHVIIQIVFNTNPIQNENKRVVNVPPSFNGK